MYVAIESRHADACLLPDVYHLFKGGSDFGSLSLVHGSAIHVMHLNDYPGDVPRAEMQDKHRVYPGDGVAPLAQILRQLITNGFAGTLSLELFNPSYWQQPAAEVLATGLAKMKAAVDATVVSLRMRHDEEHSGRRPSDLPSPG
jgi:2-keto-myo-inositol isomerase